MRFRAQTRRFADEAKARRKAAPQQEPLGRSIDEPREQLNTLLRERQTRRKTATQSYGPSSTGDMAAELPKANVIGAGSPSLRAEGFFIACWRIGKR